MRKSNPVTEETYLVSIRAVNVMEVCLELLIILSVVVQIGGCVMRNNLLFILKFACVFSSF